MPTALVDLYRAIAEISQTFVNLPPERVDDHIQDAIGRVAQLIGADRVTATQVPPAERVARRTHQWSRPGIPTMPGDDSSSPFPWIASELRRDHRPVVIAHVGQLPPDAARDRASFKEFSIASLAVLPMTVGGKMIGGLSFATVEREHDWPPELVDGLRQVAEIVASGLARKRAQVRLDLGVAFERLISDLSAAFVDLPPEHVDARVTAAIGAVATFLDLDRAQVVQLSVDDSGFEVTHQWVGDEAWRIPAYLPTSVIPWLVKTIAHERRELILDRMDAAPPEAADDVRFMARHAGPKSVAIFPLVDGDHGIGGVAFGAIRHARTWSRDVVGRLRLVAQIIASVLARRRAQVERERTLAFEQLVGELAAAFVNIAPEAVDGHIAKTLGRVAEFLDLDRSQVLQPAPDGRGSAVTHQWVRDDAWRVPEVIAAEALPWLARHVYRGDELVLSRVDQGPPDAAPDARFLSAHGMQSVAVFPMPVVDGALGAIAFDAIRAERTWSAPVIARLRLVVHIISSALARKRADLALRLAMEDNQRLRERLERENVYLQAEVRSAGDFDEIVGRSPALRAVLHKVDQVAATDAAVLLLGETGTGKELIARGIHARSRRRDHPMITVNCAALPPSLIESELFGHEKGAFTGATQARAGRFEIADGSTLFLDEIGDLDPALQAKILRALQGGHIERLGSSRTQQVDVRIVAATNRDLDAAMREGRFREDLYYRLSVFPIELPPLRERREDIPLLVWHFLQSRQRAVGRPNVDISQAAMDTLVGYDWPGNVRELQNVIDRALILSPGRELQIDQAFGRRARDVAERAAGGPKPADVEKLRDAERAHIISVLERCNWIIEGRGQTADLLGLRPSTLRNRMRKLAIRRPNGG